MGASRGSWHVTLALAALACAAACGTKPPTDTTPKPYTCVGAPVDCLKISQRWTFEGEILSSTQTGKGGPDPVVVRLDDGRYRLYYAEAIDEGTAWWGMVSWISPDGLRFEKEEGYRLQEYTLFSHSIVRNADGSFRLYWLDQKAGFVNGLGCKAIRSALSVDGGWTFVVEPGARVTYSGTGYEVNGIGAARVFLHDDTYRMYYGGVSDRGRTLSATSPDGLAFTRETGVRLDALCPPERDSPGLTPLVDAAGTLHAFTRATRCTGNYENTRAGLFDGTSVDGLEIAIDPLPFVSGYSKDGTLGNQVEPEDFTVVQTPAGLRVYFLLYNAGRIIPETALYSVIDTSIR